MNRVLIPELQECQGLADRSAITLCPHKTSALIVVRGRAWVTFGMSLPRALADAGPRGGDWFLEAGDALQVQAGQSVVIEAAGRPGERLAFGWQSSRASPRQATATVVPSVDGLVRKVLPTRLWSRPRHVPQLG